MPPGRPKNQSQPWRTSPDPEVFEDADLDKEWVVDRVVSEEIDTLGKRSLEIKWGENWHREDGSNTTWQSDLANEEILGHWERSVKDTHARLVKGGLSVELQDIETPSHVFHTFEAANAFSEKLGTSKRRDSRYKNWSLLSIPSATQSSVRRASSRNRESMPPHPNSAKRPAPPVNDERENKRKKQSSIPSIRQVLLNNWLAKCRDSGAAKIRIYNDIDDEQIPTRLDPGFTYIESGYDFGDLTFEDDDLYLAGCECEGSCETDIDGCYCQSLISDEDEQTPAYDENFLFKLDRSVVVECNKRCGCDASYCRNRVAQKGRDVEIEIFKTRDRGWGARALKDLPRGKYLGLYTGRLITREAAASLSETNPGHRSYTFDLDSLDNGADVPRDWRYSVDAHDHGNWTRFVNHSCSPNVQVYSVMWETTPQMNRPYLAFVANQDIPARTELTIDYDPKSALNKGKGRRNPGADICRCGSANCRGWVAV